MHNGSRTNIWVIAISFPRNRVLKKRFYETKVGIIELIDYSNVVQKFGSSILLTGVISAEKKSATRMYVLQIA